MIARRVMNEISVKIKGMDVFLRAIEDLRKQCDIIQDAVKNLPKLTIELSEKDVQSESKV